MTDFMFNIGLVLGFFDLILFWNAMWNKSIMYSALYAILGVYLIIMLRIA